MFRSTRVVTVTMALCGVAMAQQRFDPSMLRPIPGPVRDAGVFDWQT